MIGQGLATSASSLCRWKWTYCGVTVSAAVPCGISRVAAATINVSSIRPASIASFNVASLHHRWPILPRPRLGRCELGHSLSRPTKEVDKTGTGSGLA